MTRIDFKHNNIGVHTYVNDVDLGVFETEWVALHYIILNNLIEDLIIDRGFE